MAKYIVNPDKLGGGYSNFRIINYISNVTPADVIYKELKTTYDKGYKILLNIMYDDVDLGIHTHLKYTSSKTFIVSDWRLNINNETIKMYQFTFYENEVVRETKSIDLSKIATLEDKLNQITEEYE